MADASPAHRLLSRLGRIGVAEDDPEEVQAQKATLTVVVVVIGVLSFAWVLPYWALGLTTAAVIPLVYQLASLASLALFAASRRYHPFRVTQAVMMSVLPFALQWTLGGYVASSAVSLWALVPAVGTMFFFTASASLPWFALFLALTVASGVLDPVLAAHPAPIPDGLRIGFFVLNVAGVSVAVFVLLQLAVRARDDAHARSERLLLNVLPPTIARRLKRSPGVIAEAHDAVTVLFADVVDFTPFAEHTAPEAVVTVLDRIFSEFDVIAARHGIEKIKTIGDAYMAASGLPERRADHAEAMAEFALEIRDAFGALCRPLGADLSLRIGMESGPVVAGVIGRRKFIYDLWGDTVNTASRMESSGLGGHVQVGMGAHGLLAGRYRFLDRGEIEVKGKGRLRTHLLVGRGDDPGAPADPVPVTTAPRPGAPAA